MYKVFSKEGCPFCERTVFALKTFDKEYEVVKLGTDFTREEFIDKFQPYNHNTFPAIVKDGTFIGGFTEFKSEITFDK